MMPDQTFTVPDAGIVPIQVDIPGNSTHISVQVSVHYQLTVKVKNELNKSIKIL